MTAVWEIAEPEARAAERGKSIAASAHHTDLRLAREIALELGRNGQIVTADDIRRVLAERWPDIEPGNWLGAVWERKVWAPVGFAYSRTKGSHGNRIVQWRIKQ